MIDVETQVSHQWSVVSPWWEWPLRQTTDPDDPGPPAARRAVRTTSPTLQKYETPDVVNTFLAAPQRRLAWDPDTDEVWDVIGGSMFGSFPRRTPTHVRKLYLDAHHRHYLVTCSLHCDTAGFPHARIEDVCEAGFVVRRRRLDLPGGGAGHVAQSLRRYATARAKRIELERWLGELEARPRSAAVRSAIARSRLEAFASREGESLAEVLDAARTYGPMRALEGWIPTGVDEHGATAPMPGCTAASGLTPMAGVGSWQPVEELPPTLTEASYPLTALYADPAKPNADAAGESIYFGLVPTSSSDIDGEQRTRYDDASEFEIRCFVRRHRAACPPSGGHCTCPITWSEPSQAYRLASFFDLEGTANRPTTVQMPDLGQLHADSIRLSPGGSGGVRFVSPPNSELSFTSTDTTATKTTPPNSAQICSFAIPLITIVAFFVLQLFLPIVVFVFQLWFLLSMKFCLPPDFTVDSSLQAKLDAVGGRTEVTDGAAAALETDPRVPALMDKLLGGASDPSGNSMSAVLRGARTSNAIDSKTYASLIAGVITPAAAAKGPIQFVPRVEHWEVVQP